MTGSDEKSAAGRDALEQRAAALFDDSVDRLDAQTRSRLARARHAALDELRAPAAWRWLRGPAGGLAVATAVAVVVLLWPGASRTPTAPGVIAPDDFEIVADAESLEMLQDVEFYAWLGEQ